MSETIHIPVLPREAMEALNLKSGDTFVDATLGGGGHAMLALARIAPNGQFFAFDRDAEAIIRFKERLMREETYAERFKDGRIVLIHGSFSDVGEAIRERGVSKVSAILADLGLSSDELEDPARGFSFLREGSLDMRFDRDEGETAAEILNSRTEGELARIFREYGDVREAGRVARALVKKRKEKRFETTTELAEFVKNILRNQHASIHPATKVFQALRIAVNREEEALEKFLRGAIGLLKTNGRIAVISFHSGEERMAKRIFREDARGCVCPKEFPVCRCGRRARLRLVTRKPIVPSEEEIRANPRARSAKLRVVERI